MLHIFDKYLKGSGIEDALMECNVFGTTVIEAIMNGTHYVRSIKGMMIIADAVEKLRWKTFWSVTIKEPVLPLLDKVKLFRQSLLNMNVVECKAYIEPLSIELQALRDKFQDFINICKQRSELYKY